jgi:hypothetical protein
MYLSDIGIYKVSKYQNTVEEQHLYLLELQQKKYLTNYWENICDLFSLKLPKKFNFLDISKFNIRLGDFDGDSFEMSRIGGIGTFKRNDFNFEGFKKLSDDEKNLISLNYVRESLLEVCLMHNVSNTIVDLINEICDSIKRDNFTSTREFTKTTKWNKSRSLHAVTYLYHKQGGIDVYINVLDKKGNSKLKVPVFENRLWEFVWFEVWKGYWLDSDFVIENKNNKIVKRISVL